MDRASTFPSNAPVTGFTARTEPLNQHLLPAQPRQRAERAQDAKQDDVWYYRFDWDEQPAPWNDIYGAVHVVDLPFLFGNFGPSLFSNVWFNTANRPGRLELSAAMMQTRGQLRPQRRPERRGAGRDLGRPGRASWCSTRP